MSERTDLDAKYFIDNKVYNCPFCERRNVVYKYEATVSFDWSTEKPCYAYFVVCSSCRNTSMHLSNTQLHAGSEFKSDIDLDEHIFYSIPNSFFVLDKCIPEIIRELLTEAEGCLRMNYLTGAAACIRKAVDELAFLKKAKGENYEARIESLKNKFKQVEPELFDVLSHLKQMSGEKIDERSRDKWESPHLKLFLETLRIILHEVYVIPDERKKRAQSISSLLPAAFKDDSVRIQQSQTKNKQS